jgi:hypothetical protein
LVPRFVFNAERSQLGPARSQPTGFMSARERSAWTARMEGRAVRCASYQKPNAKN